MRIDTQSHLLPEWYLDLLAKRLRPPRVTGQGAERFIEVGSWRGRATAKMTDLAAKLRDMDAAGVDVTVLSPQFPGPEMLGRRGVDAARRLNDFIAGICRQRPDRFVGLGVLPLQDPEAAMMELSRCSRELDLRGILLWSNVHGRPLDDERFAPLFARAEAEGVPLYLHPTYPLIAQHTPGTELVAGLGFMVDTALAAIRLIMNGTFERHPGLRFVFPHTGGALTFLIGRIDHQVTRMGRGGEHIRKPPSEYLKAMYTDTVALGSLNVDFALRFWGPDRVLFASDHPFVDIQPFVDLVERAGLAPEDRAKVYAGNARQLFRIGPGRG